jgi:hypothetical protein
MPATCDPAAQASYKNYTVVPPSLQEDLVAITRVARVVQSDLYDSIKRCCSTPSGRAAFDKYTTTLASIVTAAPVNVTAVLEAGSYTAATPVAPVPKMTGHLLNSAGVKNCKVSRCCMCPAACNVSAGVTLSAAVTDTANSVRCVVELQLTNVQSAFAGQV